ncbi:MAG: hypothetical protein JSS76_11485 [Bacteroidetes bacterium]|nr:hypothetical protein [Bacteroidota bacterium]
MKASALSLHQEIDENQLAEEKGALVVSTPSGKINSLSRRLISNKRINTYINKRREL